MFRFIHTADLHLGKPFGAFPEDVRARLRHARQEGINHIASAARQSGAQHILLAGDTFDAETPSPTTIRHALNAMKAAHDLMWILLPGNHDSLAAAELWRVISNDRPSNVGLAMEPKPIILPGNVAILPAPSTVRHPGRDLTEWMGREITSDAIRIGLAHGGIRDFKSGEQTSEEGGSEVIPADRAEIAGLAYLALGDWHGCKEISPRTWYSGSPEADSFKPHAPASVLHVAIEASGAVPLVTAIKTGAISWSRAEIDVVVGEDVLQRLEHTQAPHNERSKTLQLFVASGNIALHDRLSLERAIGRSSPDYLWHSSDLSGLKVLQDTKDLDLIDANGALRAAAEKLALETANGTSDAERTVASNALTKLFSYAMEDE